MLGREVHAAAGREPGTEVGRGAAPGREPILEARGLARRGAVRGVDLTLAPGQVTGLAGLLGAGRTETAHLLFGLDAPDAGEIRVRGEVVRIDSPATAIGHGLAFCSEDRKTEGILPNLSVRENLVLALQARRGGWRRIPAQEQTGLVDAYVKALRIKTADAETPIRFLSGGNQQKVLLGRWLATRPALMILDEPTRGIDIGARAEIEQLIARLGAEGMSVLLISSELEEMVRNCTQILVLRERQLVGAVTADQISTGRLMTLMAHGAAGEGGSA
jgi:monosaccharide-transporting ATPase